MSDGGGDAFDHHARRLIRGCGYAGLGTALDGAPYVSLAAVACDHRGNPLLLLSDLAQHTRNLSADARISLLFEDTADYRDRLAGARLTLVGAVERFDDPAARTRFVARHPSAAAYAGFADFHLYRMTAARGHLVAGFGRISWIDADALRSPDAPELAAAEPDIIAHMNNDHADAVALYAERLLGLPAGPWRMTGIDVEGIDLRLDVERGIAAARLDFPSPVLNPAAARGALVALAQQARQA